MAGPLDGLKVIDFSRVLAGPLCSRTLLDLGADVTKVEPPSADVARFSAPSDGKMSGYYAQQNAGKRNISLDLNVPKAREIALRLCDTADIIVENFRAGALASFGLDYASIAERNPKAVYVSITGYGQGGPWSSRMAYAPTVQAEAGFTANSMDHYSKALRFFLAAMRRGDLVKDPRFATAASRKSNFDALHKIVQTWISSFPNNQTLDAQFDEAKIAMGEIRNLAELADTEWADYWGATQDVSDRAGGNYTLPGRPWKFSANRLEPLGDPAFQGEHNHIICSELGFDLSEIAELEELGAITPASAVASESATT